MNQKQKSQPFFWGASTSAHQVEGNAYNNWSEWEKKNAERLAEDAKQKWTPEIREKFPEMFTPENYISGKAIEHYKRFESDFDIARDGGHNAHRFNIDWARIEPEEGEFDEQAIAHYVDVVRALKERNLEPFVTLWHWTHPVWLENRGGVLAHDFARKFAHYAHVMMDALADAKVDVTYVMTLNEPMSVISSQYIKGAWPHTEKGLRAVLKAYKNLADAHIRGYDAIKKSHSDVQVGFTEILTSLAPRHNTILHKLLVKFVRHWANERFIGMTKGKYDFLGVQNYYHYEVGFTGMRMLGKRYSDLGWPLHAEGLYNVIKEYAHYGVPVYVTENGLADAGDKERPQFLHDQIGVVMRARSEGVDVRGYFHWSLFDNFEWDKGYWPRFGLVHVDYETQERTPRKSYSVYKDIIEKHQNM